VIGESLWAHLIAHGFEVTGARTFLEAVSCLVAGRASLFLVYLPEPEWVRNTILTEVHRANPAMPIVAVTPTVSNELRQMLARLHVVAVLPAGGHWTGLAEAIHNALGSPAPAP